MNRVTSGLVQTSRSWWLFASTAVLNFGAFVILFSLEDQFRALTGVPVFDTQNDLTPRTLLQQLPLYGGEAHWAYLRFAAFDFVFPAVAALFLAVTWALLLRVGPPRVGQTLLTWGLPLYPFLITGFDYLENVSLLSVIFWDAPSDFMVDGAVFFKRLKLASLGLSSAFTVALLVLAAGTRLRRVWWGSRTSQGGT